MSLIIQYSQACERNKEPIFETIKPYLETAQSVLEIGSGTGQHAVHFAQQMPHLIWQTSDQAQYIDGISAQLENANLTNTRLPFCLNVMQDDWLINQGNEQRHLTQFDLIYTANTLHIMSWANVHAFFAGLPQVMSPSAKLIIYGPFKYNGEFTSPSNQQFDLSLRSRDSQSGIRDFEDILQLAAEQGLSLALDQSLPANNQCLVFTK